MDSATVAAEIRHLEDFFDLGVSDLKVVNCTSMPFERGGGGGTCPFCSH
jgi:hypothetical protein